jgi:hypothetical protein
MAGVFQEESEQSHGRYPRAYIHDNISSFQSGVDRNEAVHLAKSRQKDLSDEHMSFSLGDDSLMLSHFAMSNLG